MTTRQSLVNAHLSRLIVAQLNAGLPMPQAFDAVMGDGAYMKLAGEVYMALRAQQ